MSSPSRRPLSPHLLIYKPQITSMLSIMHRITGVVLSLGMYVIALWVLLLLYGAEAHGIFESYLFSWFGDLLIAAWIASFFYHLFAGIRHLVWDAGYGFEIQSATKSGWLVLALTAVATVAYLGLLMGHLGDFS